MTTAVSLQQADRRRRVSTPGTAEDALPLLLDLLETIIFVSEIEHARVKDVGKDFE